MRLNLPIKFIVLCLIFMPNILAAQELLKGMYVSAFERSDFMPCGTDEHWWLSGAAFTEIEKFISQNNLRKSKDYWLPNTPVYIEVNGTKSNKGGWGHMGMYQRELIARKLVVIRDADGCDGK